ncbi:ribonuclease H-like domain-containing protein [Tanacetum coccineum]
MEGTRIRAKPSNNKKATWLVKYMTKTMKFLRSMLLKWLVCRRIGLNVLSGVDWEIDGLSVIVRSSSNIVNDIIDPLYLHSSDTNGTPLSGLKHTGTKNYRVWAAALKHCIHSKNKLGFINGKCVKANPKSEPFLAEQWESNAKLMWDELAETYDKIDGLPPTVKEAFSLLSRDESHRNMHSGSSGVKASSSTFASRFDNKGSPASFVSRPMDNKKKFNNNNKGKWSENASNLSRFPFASLRKSDEVAIV